MSLKEFWKKTWNLFWKDDSIWGWIFSLIVIIVVIKFILFPLLNFATGTTLPLAIVESCSMYHGQNFDDYWTNGGNWYEDRDITKDMFEKFNAKNGLNKGDIILIFGAKEINIGDIIIYQAPTAHPVIHRVVDLNPIQTKGDNWQTNSRQIDFEKNIQQSQIIGKATVIRIPFIGWAKLIFFEIAKKFDGNPSTNFEGLC